MKSYILTAVIAIISTGATGQTWTPNPKFAAPKTDTSHAQRVQCWGTTKKAERCKIKVDPATGAKDKAGHYYCHFHANQN